MTKHVIKVDSMSYREEVQPVLKQLIEDIGYAETALQASKAKLQKLMELGEFDMEVSRQALDEIMWSVDQFGGAAGWIAKKVEQPSQVLRDYRKFRQVRAILSSEE